MSGDSADFNVFVGSEIGLLKGVSVNPKANMVKNFHSLNKLDKKEEITSMAWGAGGGEVITGLRGGVVKVGHMISQINYRWNEATHGQKGGWCFLVLGSTLEHQTSFLTICGGLIPKLVISK